MDELAAQTSVHIATIGMQHAYLAKGTDEKNNSIKWSKSGCCGKVGAYPYAIIGSELLELVLGLLLVEGVCPRMSGEDVDPGGLRRLSRKSGWIAGLGVSCPPSPNEWGVLSGD